ncbi:type II toxin-antitoxin system PemK/MazF family toxin [Kaustia mangrovi]|uniref:Type II toxin-antitoxin system PemK/MazF family toxin n=1 Tax=Kaustia mangrovi TaxID=2593653 RepID=A0A7S8C6R6_9HYPH|nr:type II toxin-antitoxin system PemK/MazF family toxin [Kaustia mangrovi]QPC44239.1 type II toxin-antitoxin system PemK/MazF family toxin [Kaustia mangrovi]
MALNFFPRAGQIFMCDFSGFKAPEMIKTRPVIVISPKLPYRSEIAAIVPVSLTAPRHDLPFCYRLSKNYHPEEPDDQPCWAKADMIMNLGVYRLRAFKVGRRKYVYPTLELEDLAGVRRAVLSGLGLDRHIES